MQIKGFDMMMCKGDSENITVVRKDTEGSNIPFVTGDKVYMTIKENINSEPALQKIVTVFTADGKALIEILPQDTKNLKSMTYIYDIQLTREDGIIKTLTPCGFITRTDGTIKTLPPCYFTIGNEVTNE